jgi:hypothetical protein
VRFKASFPPSVPPPRRDGRKDHTNEYDQGCDLNPDEAAELSKDDFDTIAPRGRQGIADGLDAMRRSSETPFDPVGPVVKGNPMKTHARTAVMIRKLCTLA